MQALGSAKHSSHRLDGGANDVVVRILLLERNTRGLTVRSQHQRVRVLRFELQHQVVPQDACCAQLGDLHKEVHADAEKERKATGKLVNLLPGLHGGANVFDAIGEGEGNFLHGVRPSLLHVIAGDGNRVEARHFLGGVADDVGDDSHTRFWRVDVRVANHELFQNVVLDRA